jgi:hypothetical protein
MGMGSLGTIVAYVREQRAEGKSSHRPQRGIGMGSLGTIVAHVREAPLNWEIISHRGNKRELGWRPANCDPLWLLTPDS